MEEQRTYKRDGRTVTFYGSTAYVYLVGEPCKQVRVSGDLGLAFGDDQTILRVEEGADGVSTVWFVPHDEALLEPMRLLCALYAEGDQE